MSSCPRVLSDCGLRRRLNLTKQNLDWATNRLLLQGHHFSHRRCPSLSCSGQRPTWALSFPHPPHPFCPSSDCSTFQSIQNPVNHSPPSALHPGPWPHHLLPGRCPGPVLLVPPHSSHSKAKSDLWKREAWLYHSSAQTLPVASPGTQNWTQTPPVTQASGIAFFISSTPGSSYSSCDGIFLLLQHTTHLKAYVPAVPSACAPSVVLIGSCSAPSPSSGPHGNGPPSGDVLTSLRRHLPHCSLTLYPAFFFLTAFTTTDLVCLRKSISFTFEGWFHWIQNYFNSLNISLPFHLACLVSEEKSDIILTLFLCE